MLAARHEIGELSYLKRASDETIVRPEDFEDAVLRLRHAMGDLPDTEMGRFVFADAWRALKMKRAKPEKIRDAYLTISSSGKYASLDYTAVMEIITISGANPKHVMEFIRALAELQYREVNFFTRVKRAVWDGALALDRLFEGENIPSNPEVYLDQRFIDYLAKNGEDMEQIHWRNFERLTAEFFKRQGYEVELTPATKDGGVDVRVWTDRESKAGPPLILIQCKRSKNAVGLEVVKAFWADVHFERADKGLIATTSSVSRDGKRVCEARKWPMSFAESAQISRWARSMWRHAPPCNRMDG